MDDKPCAGRRPADLKYHGLATLAALVSRHRKPEFIRASRPAVPGYGPERSS
jgi:hypothetical protein